MSTKKLRPSSGAQIKAHTAANVTGPEAGVAVEPQPPARPVSPMPTSPDDADGLYRGILWVARATQECGRVLTALTDRVEEINRRLAALEAAEHPAPPSVADPTSDPTGGAGREVAAQRRALTTASAQVARLAAEVASGQRRVNERFEAIEASLAKLESAPGSEGDVQRRVDVLDARVQELGTRTAAVEELPGADLDGVYRELDAVAELVATRDDAIAQALERVGSLDNAVDGLRSELERALEGVLAARQEDIEAREWRAAVDQRLSSLESPGAQIERLYLALDGIVGQRAALEAVDVDGARADLGSGNGTGGEAWLSPDGVSLGHSHRAVEALAAELERIRLSIEAIGGQAASPARRRRPSPPPAASGDA
jgi:small-conductance mechanosensitive channel